MTTRAPNHTATNNLLQDGVILALWRQGLDTVAIAQHLHVAEWLVYSRMVYLREERTLQ